MNDKNYLLYLPNYSILSNTGNFLISIFLFMSKARRSNACLVREDGYIKNSSERRSSIILYIRNPHSHTQRQKHKGRELVNYKEIQKENLKCKTSQMYIISSLEFNRTRTSNGCPWYY